MQQINEKNKVILFMIKGFNVNGAAKIPLFLLSEVSKIVNFASNKVDICPAQENEVGLILVDQMDVALRERDGDAVLVQRVID
jgi:hypothetical protein